MFFGKEPDEEQKKKRAITDGLKEHFFRYKKDLRDFLSHFTDDFFITMWVIQNEDLMYQIMKDFESGKPEKEIIENIVKTLKHPK